MKKHTDHLARVYTDDHGGYTGLQNHVSVNHSAKQYVDGEAHTNGMESFWALLKRGYYGVYHYMSHKHLWRYANEFSGRYNIRGSMILDQMSHVVTDMIGKISPGRN